MIRRWSTRTYGIAAGGLLMLGVISVSQMLAHSPDPWWGGLLGAVTGLAFLVVTEDMPGKYDTELLDYLHDWPGRWFYVLDLCSELGWNAARVYVTLANLEQRKLVRTTWSTNRRIYSAVLEGAS